MYVYRLCKQGVAAAEVMWTTPIVYSESVSVFRQTLSRKGVPPAVPLT